MLYFGSECLRIGTKENGIEFRPDDVYFLVNSEEIPLTKYLNGIYEIYRNGICPICGNEIKNVGKLEIDAGQDVYYVDFENHEIKHGLVCSVYYYQNGNIDCFGVDFDDGDYSEFLGYALGNSFFTSKVAAETVLHRALEN